MALQSTYNSVKRAVSTAPPMDAYIAWDAPGVEAPQPSKDDTIRQIGATMNQMKQHNFDQHRRCFCATHVKTQAVVKGSLIVLPDLPIVT